MELLIVDDEKIAIQAVMEGVNWDAVEITTIHTATNIVEAKKKLNTYTIEIVLCDIEMPMGTGLELLQWINEHKLGICCIFMTCHADFSFAQQALHLGSFDYILKPLNFQSLSIVLQEAVMKVKQNEMLQTTNKYWEKGKKAVKKQFWRELYTGNISSDENSIEGYLQKNHLDISVNSRFLSVLVNPKRFPKNMITTDRKLFAFSLRNIIDEVFCTEIAEREVEAFADDIILVILTVNDDVEGSVATKIVYDCCSRLIEVTDQYLGMQVCCYIGETVSISEIPEQIGILHIMDFNNVILYKSIVTIEQQKAYYEQSGNFVKNTNGLFIGPGQYSKTVNEISLLLLAQKDSVIEQEYMQKFYMGFYFLLFDFAKTNNIFLKDLFRVEKMKWLSIENNQSIEDMVQWVQKMLDILREFEQDNVNHISPVDRVKEYIKGNLEEELSVEKIAQQVYLNPDYLNRIFKKETGVSLNRYTILQKMERAKWLLQHTNWQIGEVAASIGYYNYSSFNRVFTKIVGQSPQEWKGR